MNINSVFHCSTPLISVLCSDEAAPQLRTARNKIPWSDGTKIELRGLNGLSFRKFLHLHFGSLELSQSNYQVLASPGCSKLLPFKERCLSDLGNPSMQQISPPPKAFLRSEIGALAGCSFMFGLLIGIETQQLNIGFIRAENLISHNLRVLQ